ncbi:MAG: hypothetical protein KGR98_01570, partial [Verrucomicrobia bacterium]|nr:hypothetical protein [Verrucomicrobiota bacterium]
MNTAEEIIAKFGTQQKFAEAVGTRQSNVSYWAKTGNIPTRWHGKIIEAAGKLGIPISASDFIITPEVQPSSEIKLPTPRHSQNLTVVKSGELDIAGIKVPCAVLSNGKRVFFQREIVGLLTGNKKGGFSRYLQPSNLQPFLPEKFKYRAIEDAVFVFPYRGKIAQGFEGTDLIEICEMYLRAREAKTLDGKSVLLGSQKDLAIQAEIITRAFAKVGVVAAIDEATGYQKEKDEYQKLLAQYIAEELQPWIKIFGENYYQQIYRLKNWDWGRVVIDKKNHPWEVAKITNRIVYEKLPPGVIDKLQELNPRT